jgi:hypothetical protein
VRNEPSTVDTPSRSLFSPRGRRLCAGSAAGFWSFDFCRQRSRMVQGQLDPFVDRALLSAALSAHGEHSKHRSRWHEIPGTNVGAVKLLGGGPPVEPDYQVVTIHSTTHVSGDHKRQAPEHHLFNHVRPILESAPNAFGKKLIIRHRGPSRLCRLSPYEGISDLNASRIRQRGRLVAPRWKKSAQITSPRFRIVVGPHG